jgi:hypothetical protein
MRHQNPMIDDQRQGAQYHENQEKEFLFENTLRAGRLF